MSDPSENKGSAVSEKEELKHIIAEVTDQWDDPLDWVHDITPIVNAILAEGWHKTNQDENVPLDEDAQRDADLHIIADRLLDQQAWRSAEDGWEDVPELGQDDWNEVSKILDEISERPNLEFDAAYKRRAAVSRKWMAQHGGGV